jgi:predicted lysophospholipase L1 biosynthesis ABC-type transport system permease subunit
LKIDDQERRLAESVGFAVTLTTSALALLSILICILAAVNIAQTLFASVRARAKEIGIMQSVGASRTDIRSIILSEAAAIGFAGGACGTLGALGLERLADRLSVSYLPVFPFKPYWVPMRRAGERRRPIPHGRCRTDTTGMSAASALMPAHPGRAGTKCGRLYSADA